MRSGYHLELVDSCRDCKLKSEGFFCNLSPASLQAFEAIKFTATYPEGAVLFLEGQPPRGVFVLCSGRVKLSITSSEGKTIILRIVHPGEVLGLNAGVSGSPYQATAETLEPCQVNFIKRQDFLRFLRQCGDASLHAAEQLSASYHTACDQIRALGLSHSAPQKLGRFLLDWSARGQASPKGIRVRMTLTHEEIGQIIGSSRETVTRTLSELRNNDLVSFHGSTLVIHNKPELERLVGA